MAVADLTPALEQTPGDCGQRACVGGRLTFVADDADLPSDSNPCTDDVCKDGRPAHPSKPARVSCDAGGVCDGDGACVACLVAGDCEQPEGDCAAVACAAGLCVTVPAASDAPARAQVAGDCLERRCNRDGTVREDVDDTDVPRDANPCTDDRCSGGAPANPPLPARAACGDGALCDGDGACVTCLVLEDCRQPDDCGTAACVMGTCVVEHAAPGAPARVQHAGDCRFRLCGDAGAVETVADDADLPVDLDPCTDDLCAAGEASNPASAPGTLCSATGRRCDAGGACAATVTLVRVGDGVATLSASAAPVVLEQYFLTDGAPVPGAGASLALPTQASGAHQPLTLSGSSSSEGGLSRSSDGRFLLLGGYAAAPGTAAVAATPAASVRRTIGRVRQTAGGALLVDTTTRLGEAFSSSNIRGVASTDGVDLWAAGNGNAGAGGIWYAQLGAANATQLVGQSGNPPANVRLCQVYEAPRAPGIFQLYGSSGSGAFAGLFTVGSGLPRDALPSPPAAALLDGMQGGGAAPSPHGFALVDLAGDGGGVDTAYVADDRSLANGGGIQKWVWSAGTWRHTATLTAGLSAGARGLTAHGEDGTAVIAATTSDGKLVVLTDSGATASVATVLATAATNTAYRGVALSPLPTP